MGIMLHDVSAVLVLMSLDHFSWSQYRKLIRFEIVFGFFSMQSTIERYREHLKEDTSSTTMEQDSEVQRSFVSDS